MGVCVCGGGGGCTRTTAKQTEARVHHKNNNLVRNYEKKIMTPKSAKYEIKKKENHKPHSAKAAPNNNLNYN